jgi:hypothetical protein
VGYATTLMQNKRAEPWLDTNHRYEVVTFSKLTSAYALRETCIQKL